MNALGFALTLVGVLVPLLVLVVCAWQAGRDD